MFSCEIYKKYEWSRAEIQLPKDHIKSHIYIKEKTFLPTYDEEGRPDMYKLLGWEYYRIWKQEHDEFLGKKRKKQTITFIKPEMKKKIHQERNTKNKKTESFIMKKFKNVDARTDHKGLEPKKLRAKRLQNI